MKKKFLNPSELQNFRIEIFGVEIFEVSSFTVLRNDSNIDKSSAWTIFPILLAVLFIYICYKHWIVAHLCSKFRKSFECLQKIGWKKWFFSNFDEKNSTNMLRYSYACLKLLAYLWPTFCIFWLLFGLNLFTLGPDR